MRATFLQYRNPKEQTPCAYYPFKTNLGLPLNRFEYMSQSESRSGTFSHDQRFDHGSIYNIPSKRTGTTVGPGTYNEEEAVSRLKKKPCMSTFLRPVIGPQESHFEMQGHTRILQASYLPKPAQDTFYNMLGQYQSNLGRKVNHTLVFHETLSKNHASQSGLRRNLTMASTKSPELQHVSRIRASYDSKQRQLQTPLKTTRVSSQQNYSYKFDNLIGQTSSNMKAKGRYQMQKQRQSYDLGQAASRGKLKKQPLDNEMTRSQLPVTVSGNQAELSNQKKQIGQSKGPTKFLTSHKEEPISMV